MARTREDLLRAGEELFAKDGLDGPSLDAICARAEKTRGAFYVHFKDRDDFLAAVMERVGMPFLDAVLGAAGGEPVPLEEAAERFVAAFASGAYPLTKGGALRPSQLIDACARSKRVRDRYATLIEEAIARLARAIEAAQRAGRVRADVPPEGMATLLLAAIIGAQTMSVDLRLPLRLGDAAATILALLSAEAARPRRA
jgi:AcrR family transcriptional regulator